MGGKLDEIFQRREEVWVPVRNDIDKYLPVSGYRVRLRCLLDDLGKVERGGVVVELQCWGDLLQSFFTLEEYGAAQARDHIVSLLHRVAIGEQTKRSHLRGGYFPHLVEVLVQEDNQ